MRLPQPAVAALAAVCLSAVTAPTAWAQVAYTWIGGNSGTWTTGTSWSPTGPPANTGDSATFNADQTANRSVTGATGSIGSLTINTSNVPANDFTNSIAGSLTFDQTGTGPATLAVTGNGTKLSTISAAVTLTDTLDANITNTTSTSTAGALTFTAGISGPGGFIKDGGGLVTFGTTAKTYTGPTVLNAGTMRISVSGSPTGTSSFTINNGGQLTFTSTNGTVNLGTGSLFLNGTGLPGNPGAIRPERLNSPSSDYTIANNVVLQTDSVIHVQAQNGSQVAGNPLDSLTLSGVISGPGRLQFTGNLSNIDQGTLILSNANGNTWTGGTLVAGGILKPTGSPTGTVGTATVAELGTGNVTVDNTVSPASVARLSIPTPAVALTGPGTTNAIDDGATLTLSGGGSAGVADQNFAILGSGVNEVVGGLILGGVTEPAGTYGATGSGAANIFDEYFSGPGMITVQPVPEPGVLALAGLAAGGSGARLLRRRKVAG